MSTVGVASVAALVAVVVVLLPVGLKMLCDFIEFYEDVD
jgi:hypothetical protein